MTTRRQPGRCSGRMEPYLGIGGAGDLRMSGRPRLLINLGARLEKFETSCTGLGIRLIRFDRLTMVNRLYTWRVLNLLRVF
jgi:hypothetical protein